MPHKKIELPRETMRSILYGDSDVGAVISDEVTDNSRWSIYHDLFFTYEGKTYRTGYSIGATEMQDEFPWEYDSEVECIEVHKVQRLVDVWEVVSDDGQI